MSNQSLRAHHTPPAHHRTRPVHSHRKLGAVLTNNSFLLDLDTSPAAIPIPIAPLRTGASVTPLCTPDLKKRRRCGYIAHSTSSSISSFDSLNTTSYETKDRPLVLRLDIHPESLTGNRWSFPPSPTTPISPRLQPDLRRRKMAKLERTLGEQVPVHLVFPPRSKNSLKATSSVHSTAKVTLPFRPHRNSNAPFTRESTIIPVDQFNSLFPVETFEPSEPSEPARAGEEPEWTGEWNLNMKYVQRALRDLKAR